MGARAMDLDRRRLLALTAAGLGTAAATPALAAPSAPTASALGLDAGQFGLRPGSPDDQSRALLRALEEAARTRTRLALAPGVYRVGGIKLPAGAHLSGVRGGTRLVLANGPSLLAAAGAEQVTLSGLKLDGGRCPSGAVSCSWSAARPSRSPIARSPALAATASCWSRAAARLPPSRLQAPSMSPSIPSMPAGS